jgi:ubiquinone/menaquinone biosynthesis C-methylase UbiE
VCGDWESEIVKQWLLKQLFHLLYYQLAWSYDLVAWCVSFGQWSAWRRLAIQFLRPGPTLELAYGTGGLFVDLSKSGCQPVGIDLSPYMARLTKRRLQQENLSITICQAKSQALPFPSGYFRNVVATFPTDYIFQKETLTEIHRVLSSESGTSNSGRLIVVFEGQLRGPWPIRPFIEWLYKITGQRDNHHPQPTTLIGEHAFVAHWKIVEQEGAIARLLIADK